MERHPWVSIFYTAFLHLKQLFWAQQHTSKLSFSLYILTRPYPKLVGFDTLSIWVETRKQNWSEEFTTWVTAQRWKWRGFKLPATWTSLVEFYLSQEYLWPSECVSCICWTGRLCRSPLVTILVVCTKSIRASWKSKRLSILDNHRVSHAPLLDSKWSETSKRTSWIDSECKWYVQSLQIAIFDDKFVNGILLQEINKETLVRSK